MKTYNDNVRTVSFLALLMASLFPASLVALQETPSEGVVDEMIPPAPPLGVSGVAGPSPARKWAPVEVGGDVMQAPCPRAWQGNAMNAVELKPADLEVLARRRQVIAESPGAGASPGDFR